MLKVIFLETKLSPHDKCKSSLDKGCRLTLKINLIMGDEKPDKPVVLSVSSVVEREREKVFGKRKTNKGHGITEFIAHHHSRIEKKESTAVGETAKIVESGDFVLMKKILKKDPLIVNWLMVQGESLLHIAATAGQPSIALLLMEAGAFLNVKNSSNFNPLQTALLAQRGNALEVLSTFLCREDMFAQVFSLLLRSISVTFSVFFLITISLSFSFILSTSHQSFLINISSYTKVCLEKTSDCVSGLHLLSQYKLYPLDQTSLFRELFFRFLDFGIDPNDQTVTGDTALHIAAKCGHFLAIELLVARGALIDLPNQNKETPLMLAVLGAHLQCVNLLLTQGANWTLTDHCSISIVEYALQSPNHDIRLRFKLLQNFSYIPSARLPKKSYRIHWNRKWSQMIQKCFPKIGNLSIELPLICFSIRIYDFLQNRLKKSKRPTAHTADELTMSGKAILTFFLEECDELGGSRTDAQTVCSKMTHSGVLVATEDTLRRDFVEGNNYKFDVEPLWSSLQCELFSCASGLEMNSFEEITEYLSPFLPQLQSLLSNNNRKTALHFASACRNEQGIERLLAAPFSIPIDFCDTDDNANFTALHWACSVGGTEVIEMLLKNNANVRITSRGRVLPIHILCSSSRKFSFKAFSSIVKRFMQAGVSINAIDAKKNTPLHYLCWANPKTKFIQFLLDNGANPFASNELLNPPLFIAIECRCPDQSLTLLATKDCVEIIALAITTSNLMALDVLYQTSHEKNTIYRLSGGLTSLLLAAKHFNEDIVQYLLAHGSNINETDLQGRGVLHYAVTSNDLFQVLFFLDKGAIPNVGSVSGTLPLHILCSLTIIESMKKDFDLILDKHIEMGIPINIKNAYGLTPLHFAGRGGGNAIIASSLIQKGASVGEKNCGQQSALAFALASRKDSAGAVPSLLKTIKCDFEAAIESADLNVLLGFLSPSFPAYGEVCAMVSKGHYFVQTVRNLKKVVDHSKFVNYLKSHHEGILSLASHVIASNQRAEFVLKTVALFEWLGVIGNGVEFLFRSHIADCSDPTLLFRANTLASLMGSLYVKRSCTNYLRYLISRIYNAVSEFMKEHPTGMSDLDDDGPSEVTNMLFERLCTNVWGIVTQSTSMCPTPLRRLAYCIRESVSKRFLESADAAVGGLYFLRFLCPALIAPETMDEFLPMEVAREPFRRVVVSLTKILQNIANQTKQNIPRVDYFTHTTSASFHTMMREISSSVVDFDERSHNAGSSPTGKLEQKLRLLHLKDEINSMFDLYTERILSSKSTEEETAKPIEQIIRLLEIELQVNLKSITPKDVNEGDLSKSVDVGLLEKLERRSPTSLKRSQLDTSKETDCEPKCQSGRDSKRRTSPNFSDRKAETPKRKIGSGKSLHFSIFVHSFFILLKSNSGKSREHIRKIMKKNTNSSLIDLLSVSSNEKKSLASPRSPTSDNISRTNTILPAVQYNENENKPPQFLLVDFHTYLKKKLCEWERTVDELGLTDCVETIKLIYEAFGQTPFLIPSFSEHYLETVKNVLLAFIDAGANIDEVDAEMNLTSIGIANQFEDPSFKSFLMLKIIGNNSTTSK
jgi:ankyrin repeat protein